METGNTCSCFYISLAKNLLGIFEENSSQNWNFSQEFTNFSKAVRGKSISSQRQDFWQRKRGLGSTLGYSLERQRWALKFTFKWPWQSVCKVVNIILHLLEYLFSSTLLPKYKLLGCMRVLYSPGYWLELWPYNIGAMHKEPSWESKKYGAGWMYRIPRNLRHKGDVDRSLSWVQIRNNWKVA